MPSYDAEITAAGHVLPCCNDYHEQMRMGNVKDTPLKEIWLNDKFTQFRRDLKRGLRHKYVICKDCNF
jgi:radical SAM protein with 4Fe4S-binding SPASM domain